MHKIKKRRNTFACFRGHVYWHNLQKDEYYTKYTSYTRIHYTSPERPNEERQAARSKNCYKEGAGGGGGVSSLTGGPGGP